jgi:hypothetical protein
MVQKTIEKIEEKIRSNDSLSKSNKTELLDLLAKLKPEITQLAKAQSEHAENPNYSKLQATVSLNLSRASNLLTPNWWKPLIISQLL